MRNSRLRKKSPVFRQGYRTARDVEPPHAKLPDRDVPIPADWDAYVDEVMEQLAEQYTAGDIEGYRRGYSDGRDSKTPGVKLTAVVATLLMVALGGLFIGIAL